MQTAISHEHKQARVIGSIWSAWMIAVVAGLILYGMVDDSPLATVMSHSSIFAASWKVIQVGCVLAISSIAIAGLPLTLSIGRHAVRGRRRDLYLRLAIPFISIFVLFAWLATVLIFTGGHWAASPWAVAFSRPDWPSYSVRWTTGTISAILLVLSCIASTASVSSVLRDDLLHESRIALFRGKVQTNPLSFAAALAPWVASGIFVMLTGVVAWGFIASRLSAMAFRGLNGPLGLPGLAAWILSTALFGFATILSGQAVWRSRVPPSNR